MQNTIPIRDALAITKLIGFSVELDTENGQAHCVLPVQDRHLNRHAVVHGGVSATLLDTASGVTASLTVDDTGMVPFTTVSLNLNYLAAAHQGTLCATGRVTGGGRALTFVDAELRDQDGRLIATSSGVFKRVRQPEGSPS